MKFKCICLTAALLVLCLLAGCAAQNPAAKPETAPDAASTEAHATGEPLTQSETASLDLGLDQIWRSEQEDVPGEGRLIRELVLGCDEHTYTYRCGDPDSEFSYWAQGSWTLEGDRLTLTVLETDEEGNPAAGAESYESVWTVSRDGDTLVMTLCSARGFEEEAEGLTVTYQPKPEEE